MPGLNPMISDYEKDFYAWAIKNAQLLKKKKFSQINPVDIKHIAEELADMGKSEKRELHNRLAVLIAYLLKWEFQPKKRSNSWKATLNHQRFRLEKLLKESPSLKHSFSKKISDAYQDALFMAAEETKMIQQDFPQNSAYTAEQLLNNTFFPE